MGTHISKVRIARWGGGGSRWHGATQADSIAHKTRLHERVFAPRKLERKVDAMEKEGESYTAKLAML